MNAIHRGIIASIIGIFRSAVVLSKKTCFKDPMSTAKCRSVSPFWGE